MVDMELHPHGIAPIFKKYISNLFLCIKFYFFLQFSFLYMIYSLVNIIVIKPAPGDHKSNFKKMGAILCGCNTKWTPDYIDSWWSVVWWVPGRNTANVLLAITLCYISRKNIFWIRTTFHNLFKGYFQIKYILLQFKHA